MPGSHDWRTRAASQITQQLPDNTAGPLAVRDAAVRHIWPKAEYERALDLINRGYDKRIVAQIIGRTIGQLNDKLHYERMQMEDGKRQQRRQQRRRAQAQGIELAPASVLEERTARQAAEYRDLTSEFFGDPRPGYSQLDRRGTA